MRLAGVTGRGSVLKDVEQVASSALPRRTAKYFSNDRGGATCAGNLAGQPVPLVQQIVQ